MRFWPIDCPRRFGATPATGHNQFAGPEKTCAGSDILGVGMAHSARMNRGSRLKSGAINRLRGGLIRARRDFRPTKMGCLPRLRHSITPLLHAPPIWLLAIHAACLRVNFLKGNI